MSNLIYIYIILVIFNLVLFYFNFKIAHKLDLFDKPDNIRKLHTTNVPLTGGLFFLLNLFLIFILNTRFQIIYGNFLNFNILIFYFFLFFLGFYDDKKNINPNIKLLFSVLFFLFFIFFNKNFVIKELFFSSDFKIELGFFSIPFTIFCFVIFQNAFNMFDGINLQNILYFIFLIFIIHFNIFNINILIFLTPVLILLVWMNANNKLFLGDSGSYLLSFFISTHLIYLFNNKEIIYSDNIFLFLCIPGFDLLRLAIFRIIKKQHPFRGDREHLHHLLLERFSFLKTLLYLNAICFVPILLCVYFDKTFYPIILSILLYLLTLGYLIYNKKKKYNFKNN